MISFTPSRNPWSPLDKGMGGLLPYFSGDNAHLMYNTHDAN
jgi:hypothetical protein